MFNIGDLVKLKSGGPVMVITFIFNNGKLACQWFSGDDVHHEISVAKEAVVHVS